MSFECSAINGTSVADLDGQTLATYIAKRAPSLAELSAEEAGCQLGLLIKVGSRVVATPVGLLCFGRFPQLMQPQWGVSVSKLDGLSLSDPIIQLEHVEGCLTSLLNSTLQLIAEHTRSLRDHTGGAAAAEYSPLALREALVNALVHRDLRKPGRVSVRIFDDRLEIWNPGGLLEPTWDLDALMVRGGASMPRNPLLAATARVLGMGDQIGRGLTVLRRSITQLSNQRLEVQASASAFLLVIPSLMHHGPNEPRLTQ